MGNKAKYITKKFILYIVIILIIFISILLLNRYNKEMLDKFIEPEGYVIAEVTCRNFTTGYRYISIEDYQSFINGTLTGSLLILHPTDANKTYAVKVDEIRYIEVGEYKLKNIG